MKGQRIGHSLAAAIISVVLGATAIGLGVFLLPPFAMQRWGMIAGAAGVAVGAWAKRGCAANGPADWGIWVSLAGIMICTIMMVIVSTQLSSF